MRSKSNQKKWLPILLFCISAGLIATLWGYNYSAGNAEEQLPFIYRALNPSFLTRDFFTNTFAQYGPRTIFSEFIALFARIAPLTIVLFSLTFIANIAIAYLSSLTTRFFFKESEFSAYLAAASVLTIKTFWLGYSNIIYRTFLEPAHLAMPFLLLGFYLTLQKKYIIAAFCFGIAALFHPLLGLETGWLLLGVSFFILLIQVVRKEAALQNGRRLAIAGVVLACFSIGLFLPYSSEATITSDIFIKLIAYVRHPHHYVPSTFELWQYGQAAVYLTAFGFVFWHALKRSISLQTHKRLLLLTGALILVLCIGGYLFVEVWPSRIWTSAQMFRLPYLIKWFSIILIAGWVGDMIDSPRVYESRLVGLTAGIGMVTPVSLVFVTIAMWLRTKILPRLKFPTWLLHDKVILVLTVFSIILYKPEFRTWSLFLILYSVIWIMFALRWKISGSLFSTTILLIAAVIFLNFGSHTPPPDFLKYEVPVLSLYKTTGETAEMANFVKANTPPDALFLTPPKFGEFRYMAERAIVVDLVAFPFQDNAMLEWYNRMTYCYGTSELLGFNALPDFNHYLRTSTDVQLSAIAEKYGIDYAVVYDDTNTNYPILFTTESLKLVQIVK